MKFIMDHPALLALFIPTILAAIPALLGKIEKAAIAKLLSFGDSADQKLLRSIAKAIVVWGEEKGVASGADKFAAADKLLARAVPFLTAEQRKGLIEPAVTELDKEANAAIDGAGK